MSGETMTSHDIWKQIGNESICMYSDFDGRIIRSRPMSPIIRRDENCVWFVTDRDSTKVRDLTDDSPVTLTFQNSASNWYVSLVGAASVVDDRTKIAELWSPLMKEWFEGPGDPAIVLIAIEPLEADYWKGPNRLVAGLKMLVTATTGMKTDMGDAGKVPM
jgi:general stress protein 26